MEFDNQGGSGGTDRPRRTRAAAPRKRRPAASAADPEPDQIQLARTTAPRELYDDAKRSKWGLPPLSEPDETGPYIVELNAEHASGLPGAEILFKEVLKEALIAVGETERAEQLRPRRISKSYYRCDLKDKEWRRLVAIDEQKPLRERAVYRLWPDFPVRARTDRSIATIKADAAFRSFAASGEGITWAVIDSGVQADHPHFGPTGEAERESHTLMASAVDRLHRCFADVPTMRGGKRVIEPLLNPDDDPGMDSGERAALIEEHRRLALTDDYGHGTHVAGILAGRAPTDEAARCALEHQYTVDASGDRQTETFAIRSLRGNALPRGVAPDCKLISLRVLDAGGDGRASQVIQALEYIRERINDNPKIMRVHGVNLSVGYEFDAQMFACGQSPLCTTVDRLVQEGVVVVTAAGNTGYGSVAADVRTSRVGLSNTINDPGNAALAITVGATHRESPHRYGVSYFSSKGPTADGRLKPDLVAPGERITSCAAGLVLRRVKDVKPGVAYYVDDTGTSMAAPHVSGAIAAFLSIRREFIGQSLEVKRIFLESAIPLGRERYFEGHGLVDLMRAIQSV